MLFVDATILVRLATVLWILQTLQQSLQKKIALENIFLISKAIGDYPLSVFLVENKPAWKYRLHFSYHVR